MSATRAITLAVMLGALGFGQGRQHPQPPHNPPAPAIRPSCKRLSQESKRSQPPS